ncbi:MAG: hypothetical protein OHK0046_16560 [Anaerolineae bacterium]
MDRQRIVEVLGLVSGGDFTVTDIQMVQWGRDVIFECAYQTIAPDNTPDQPVTFRLIFHDCREIKYKVYAHISLHEHGEITQTADIADLLLGQGNHRRDANILTNCFGATLSYGDVRIEKDGQTYTF